MKENSAHSRSAVIWNKQENFLFMQLSWKRVLDQYKRKEIISQPPRKNQHVCLKIKDLKAKISRE
jgi:hypothetical protein